MLAIIIVGIVVYLFLFFYQKTTSKSTPVSPKKNIHEAVIQSPAKTVITKEIKIEQYVSQKIPTRTLYIREFIEFLLNRQESFRFSQGILDILINPYSAHARYQYRTYKIPKRNSNKTRTINHPSKELKLIQRLMVKYLKNKFIIYNSAYAYKNKIGIRDNAFFHLKTKYLLKMDFEDFFHSITPRLFFYIAEKQEIKISSKDESILTELLFLKGKKLSIGAPSSPLISNFILYFFDEKIEKICHDNGIKYSRYADDLTFSSNEKNILFCIPNIVVKTIKEESMGLIRVNRNKTIFSSKAHNRHITGVTLTNDNKLSIGRERKRIISSMIHKFSLGELNKNDILKLQGLFSFASYIEQDFSSRMSKKYGENVILNLKNVHRSNAPTPRTLG